MRIVAMACAVVFCAAPDLAAADGSGGSSSVQVPVTSAKEAAAAISAPFALVDYLQRAEIFMGFAGSASATAIAAAEGVDPDFIAAEAARSVGDDSRRRKALARQALESLARGIAMAAQGGFGSAVPATVVPCPDGGYSTIEGTPGVEYVLQLQYFGCRTNIEFTDIFTENNGSILVGIQALGGRTTVTRVRFGAADQPYTESNHRRSTGFLTGQLTLRYEIAGVLADFTKPIAFFAHKIAGSFVEDAFSDGEGQDPGSPFQVRGHAAYTLDNLVMTGFFFGGQQLPTGAFVLGRDTRILRGAINVTGFSRDQFGNLLFSDTRAMVANGVRIVDKFDLTTFNRTLAFEGGFGLTYGPAADPGCMSGAYSVTTLKPVEINPSFPFAGQLQVNRRAEAVIDEAGTATLKFDGTRLPFSSLFDLMSFGECRNFF